MERRERDTEMWPGGIGILHVYLPPAELDVNPSPFIQVDKARQGKETLFV